MKPQTIIGIIAAFFVAAFIASKLANYYVASTTPDVISDVESTAKSDNSISAIIGNYEHFTSTYNEHDLAKDTIPFSVTIFGSKASIQLKGKAKRTSGKHWSITTIDTLYTLNH